MDYIEITCLFFFCKIYIQYVLKNYVLELIYVRIQWTVYYVFMKMTCINALQRIGCK